MKLMEYKWVVEFMKFDLEGVAILGSSWFWRGEAYGAPDALQIALNAMIGELDDAGYRRCVHLTNLTALPEGKGS